MTGHCHKISSVCHWGKSEPVSHQTSKLMVKVLHSQKLCEKLSGSYKRCIFTNYMFKILETYEWFYIAYVVGFFKVHV